MKKLKLNSKITPKKYYLILIGTYLIQVAIAVLIGILWFFVIHIYPISDSLALPIFASGMAGLVAVLFTMTYRYAIAKIEKPMIIDFVLYFLLNEFIVFELASICGAVYQFNMEHHYTPTSSNNNFIMPLADPLNWLFLFLATTATICILAFLTARFRPFFDKTWKYLGASPVIVLCIILAFQWLLPHDDLITDIFCIGIAIIFSLIGGYELFQASTCEKTIYNALDKSTNLFLSSAAIMGGVGTTKKGD